MTRAESGAAGAVVLIVWALAGLAACGQGSESGHGAAGGAGGAGGAEAACSSPSDCADGEYCTSECEPNGACLLVPAGTFVCGGSVCTTGLEYCRVQLTGDNCYDSHCYPLPSGCHDCACAEPDAGCSGGVFSCNDDQGEIEVDCIG